MLALGQAERLVGAGAEVLGERGDGVAEAVGRHRLRLAPRAVALGQRAGAGQDLVEGRVGGGEAVLGHAPGAHAVAGLDLVRVPDGVAAELGRGRDQTGALGPQPPTPAGVQPVEVAGAVEVGHQARRLGDELAERDPGLGLHPPRQRRRSVVGVDEPVEVAPEAQAEQQVALDERGAGRHRPHGQ
ncbi:MAG: hypothetical protein KDB35_11530 [Acidimicrobiales bacterium]|nr:hypothetical protein [Acidimicrobiales bacterium]